MASTPRWAAAVAAATTLLLAGCGEDADRSTRVEIDAALNVCADDDPNLPESPDDADTPDDAGRCVLLPAAGARWQLLRGDRRVDDGRLSTRGTAVVAEVDPGEGYRIVVTLPPLRLTAEAGAITLTPGETSTHSLVLDGARAPG